MGSTRQLDALRLRNGFLTERAHSLKNLKLHKIMIMVSYMTQTVTDTHYLIYVPEITTWHAANIII
jgi:hypothetical protein